jgi:catechol 2,3-dioxygenase-like lactoylglutathione lyase family enzyme
MGASAHHHPALRVADIERAARFYCEAFDGHLLTRPFTIEGDFAEVVMDGPPGVAFRVCMVGFEEGCLELFEFVEPVHPIAPVHPTRGNLIHFGIKVDDVEATLALVEAAGSRRLWSDINPWGTAKVIYVTDPDRNIVEITDASMEEIVQLTIASIPEADPQEVHR